jgi:hypothetical protein
MAPVQHVVAMSFKPETSQSQVDAFFSDAARMAVEIPGIQLFLHGPNISPEGLGKGLTHAFIMTFESAAARDVYLPHPLHEAFKAKHLVHVEDVLVIDI